MYHVAAIERGENVRLSEDFFIEARKDSPPTVRSTGPGRDAKVNPIEEVTVTVNAEDDFGAERTEPALFRQRRRRRRPSRCFRQKGVKTAERQILFCRSKTTSSSPGDLVSYLRHGQGRAQHHQNRHLLHPGRALRTQLLAGASPAAAGAAMGGGDDDQQISQRQKDIIAATWNEQKNGSKDPSESADDAQVPGRAGREAGRAGQIAGRSHEGARTGRRQSAIPELRQGNGRAPPKR